jgi:hypothetical protein
LLPCYLRPLLSFPYHQRLSPSQYLKTPSSAKQITVAPPITPS